jgi:hypothetical protein
MSDTIRNILIAVVVLIIVGVGWYFLYGRESAPTTTATTPTTTPTQPPK